MRRFTCVDPMTHHLREGRSIMSTFHSAAGTRIAYQKAVIMFSELLHPVPGNAVTVEYVYVVTYIRRSWKDSSYCHEKLRCQAKVAGHYPE